MRTRLLLASKVLVALASLSCGLLGVCFLGFAGWTYIGSVEVLGRFPQGFKDAIREEAASQLRVGVLLILACIVLIPLIVFMARERWT